MINTRMNNLIETSADPVVILGIDHGFGNIKTAHACFRAGVTACNHDPTFRSNLLVHQGRCYIIGEEHKEFTPDKMRDDDYYLLTLSAIGRELKIRGLTSARVVLGVGLPLTWVGEQREAFRSYLLRDSEVDFTFRDVEYALRQIPGRPAPPVCVRRHHQPAEVSALRPHGQPPVRTGAGESPHGRGAHSGG